MVNPEFVDDIEVGFKTDWQIGDVSMRTDVAGYNQWYRDIVRSEFVFIGGTAYNVNRNVASAIIRGLEIEQTVAFSRALRLTAGYAFTDAYFTTESVAVRQFPEVPRHQFNLNANARLPLPDALGELLVNANWSQRSSQATDQNAVSPAAFRPGYSLLDLSLNWNNAFGAGLDIAAYIKNATDEVYILAGGDFLSSLGFLQGIYGEPRTYGLRLTYRFGD